MVKYRNEHLIITTMTLSEDDIDWLNNHCYTKYKKITPKKGIMHNITITLPIVYFNKIIQLTQIMGWKRSVLYRDAVMDFRDGFNIEKKILDDNDEDAIHFPDRSELIRVILREYMLRKFKLKKQFESLNKPKIPLNKVQVPNKDGTMVCYNLIQK
jgi:hypothetical protein